jgi:hypothetical protein
MSIFLRVYFIIQLIVMVVQNYLLLRKYSLKAGQFYSDIQDGKYNNAKKRVFFYPGCTIEYFYPYIGIALVKLLQKAEIAVDIPKKQFVVDFLLYTAVISQAPKRLYWKIFNTWVTQKIMTLF